MMFTTTGARITSANGTAIVQQQQRSAKTCGPKISENM